MPRGDKTGPQGLGSLTGRGLGLCGTGTNQFNGRGSGRGSRRMNRNFGNTSFASSIADEKELLEKRLDIINKQLDK